MQKLITWTLLAILLMIGCPWFAVEFAGSAGMAICFVLLYQAIVDNSHNYSRIVLGRSMAIF